MVPRPPPQKSAAPVYKVDDRKIVSVEHPMIIKDIEKGIKTFGNNRPFQRVSLLILVSRVASRVVFGT